MGKNTRSKPRKVPLNKKKLLVPDVSLVEEARRRQYEERMAEMTKENEKLKQELSTLARSYSNMEWRLEVANNENKELQRSMQEIVENKMRPIFLKEHRTKDKVNPRDQLIQKCLHEGKKCILYCEGNYKSIDFSIYSLLYQQAMVIPVNSWSSVEENVTKTMKSRITYGIIDKDSRGNIVTNKLRKQKMFPIGVRAVENLFVTDEFLLMLFGRLKIKKPKTTLTKLKKEALEELVNMGNTLVKQEDALIDFPSKKVLHFVETKLGMRNGLLMKTILNLLNTKNRKMLLKVWSKYLPTIE